MKSRYLFGVLIVLTVINNCDKHSTEPDSEKNIWNFSTPQAQGMNPQILDSAFIRARQTGFVDGLLIIKNGYLIAEEYYNGYDETMPHNIKSVSKSFLSAITGIALQQGYMDSLEEKVLNYFP